MNIRIWVCNPRNLKDCEVQTYSNYSGLTVAEIREDLMNVSVTPEVGNFPHMGGTNSPVKITNISATGDEDNAGLDIKEVISRFKGWGSNST